MSRRSRQGRKKKESTKKPLVSTCATRNDDKPDRAVCLPGGENKGKPGDPRYHHFIAVSLLGKRLYKKALGQAEMALRLAPDRQGESLYLWTRFVAAVSCINLGRTGEAARLCREALSLDPSHLDSYYILSSISYSRGSLRLFLEDSDHYLSLLNRAKNSPRDFEGMTLNTVDLEWRIRLHRGFAFEQLGIVEKAREEYELSLEACPDRSEYSRLRSDFDLSRSVSDTSGRLDEPQRGAFPEHWSVAHSDTEHTDSATTIKPGITLCMIVKNEEELLPKCLDSAKDHVDEMVVVDTGSADRTVEIAESYGASVFFHPWEGDFSKHRNQSIGYATREWILILDADEELEKNSAGFLRDVLKDEAADSIYLSVRSAFDEGKGEAVHNSIRLFRNNGRIYYEGRVHNQLVGEQSSRMYPITVFHEGYNLPAQKSHRKFVRTTELLKKEVEERPDQPRAYHYLAASYLSEGMYRDAFDFATKAIDLAEKHGYSDHLYLWSHFIGGISSLKQGNLEEAEGLCLRALGKNHAHLDSHYLLTLIYYNLKQWERVLVHGREYCRLVKGFTVKPGEFGQMVLNTINHRWRIHAHLGFALENLNNVEGAEKELLLAEELCTEQGEYHKLLAGHCLSKSDFTASEAHFKVALESLPSDLDLLKIGVETYSKLKQTEKAKELLRRIITLDESPQESAFRLGAILLEQNSPDEASELFQRVLEGMPHHTGALINMGLVAKRQKRFDEAISFFRRALREDPFSVEGLSNLGSTLYHKRDLAGAEEALGTLLGISPELTDALVLLSNIHVQQGQLDRAVEDCDALLRLLNLDRGVILHSLSDLADLYLKIGETFLRHGKLTAAHLAFETALLLGKNAPHVFQRILTVYAESGITEGAKDPSEKEFDLDHVGSDSVST